jgi:hypothetical protein
VRSGAEQPEMQTKSKNYTKSFKNKSKFHFLMKHLFICLPWSTAAMAAAAAVIKNFIIF